MKLLIIIFCVCLLFGSICISSSITQDRNKIRIKSIETISFNSKEDNATVFKASDSLNSNNTFDFSKNFSLSSDDKNNLKLENKVFIKVSSERNNSVIENNNKRNIYKVKNKEKKKVNEQDNFTKIAILDTKNTALTKKESNHNGNRKNNNLKISDNIVNQKVNKTEIIETYFYDYEEDEYDNAYNLSRYHNFIFKNKCNRNRCAEPKGQCLQGDNDRICRCAPSYLNFKYPNGEVLVCGYNQKSQFIAFVLEFSLLFAGNIYLGFYFYAYIKGIVYLTIFLFAYFKLPCRLCGLDNMIKSKCYLCPWVEYTTIIIVIFGIFCWQTVDLVKIITPNNKDAFYMPILDYF